MRTLIALVSGLAFAASLQAQAITLGPTVSTFGVLGSSTVTNSGFTTIQGNLGVSPSTSVTGFPPGTVTGGTIHLADAVAGQAQVELTSAYTAAAAAPCTTNLSGVDLGGLILTPGVYCFDSSAQLTGTLTITSSTSTGQIIIRVGTALTTASGSAVTLTNLAQSGNIFWELGSSATIGTGAGFAGNILAQASISLGTGAVLQGRALARTGAVTLLSNSQILPVDNGGGGGGGGGGAPGLPATPAPTSLLLVSIGLVAIGIYSARARLISRFKRN